METNLEKTQVAARIIATARLLNKGYDKNDINFYSSIEVEADSLEGLFSEIERENVILTNDFYKDYLKWLLKNNKLLSQNQEYLIEKEDSEIVLIANTIDGILQVNKDDIELYKKEGYYLTNTDMSFFNKLSRTDCKLIRVFSTSSSVLDSIEETYGIQRLAA